MKTLWGTPYAAGLRLELPPPELDPCLIALTRSALAPYTMGGGGALRCTAWHRCIQGGKERQRYEERLGGKEVQRSMKEWLSDCRGGVFLRSFPFLSFPFVAVVSSRLTLAQL